MGRFVVTGATGHIGNVIIRLLADQGIRPVAFVLPKDSLAPLEGTGCEVAYGNVCDRESLDKAIREGDTVIHLAGIISIAPGKEKLLYDVNVQGTMNVADACLAKGARLIYASSVHVLPANADGSPIRESLAFNTDSERGGYEHTKSLATAYMAEQMAKGLKASIVFPSAIIGPYDFFYGEVSQALVQVHEGKLPGYIKGGYSFVDVRDVAKAIIAIAKKEKFGENYILAAHYITIKDLMLKINRISGRKHLPPYIPLWLVYMCIPFFALSSKLTHKKAIFTKVMVKTVTTPGDFDISKAKGELGYAPRPLDDTLKDSLTWLKKSRPDSFKKR